LYTVRFTYYDGGNKSSYVIITIRIGEPIILVKVATTIPTNDTSSTIV